MSQAKVPDVSEMTIRMDAISPEAEQQLNELCWESQRAVLRLLLNDQSAEATVNEFSRLAGLRVYRMRVTDPSVSVSFAFSKSLHREFRLEA